MPTLQELSDKIDELNSALQTEQQQVADAIADLNTTITDLEALVEAGGSESDRQAILDKIIAIKEDLEGTVTP